MKRSLLYTAPLAIGLVAVSLQLAPNLKAQSQSQPSAQQEEQKPQTFVGKVVKVKNGQYALLLDEQDGKGVYLDDQEKVKAFEGKNVKVTGTLDMAKNVIHVTDIQAAGGFASKRENAPDSRLETGGPGQGILVTPNALGRVQPY